MAFNFCQPFLINRAVTFSQQSTSAQTTNIGYGLIGAYVLVYVGIAVRSEPYRTLDIANSREDLHWTEGTSDLSLHYHDARWLDIDALR